MSVDSIHEVVEPVVDSEFGPWLAQASILVVDDEPGMRNFLVKTLGPRCQSIQEASDTKEASRRLDAQHFDVVILDNVMPGENGLDWLAKQRAIGLFADVILMTAYSRSGYRHRGSACRRGRLRPQAVPIQPIAQRRGTLS